MSENEQPVDNRKVKGKITDPEGLRAGVQKLAAEKNKEAFAREKRRTREVFVQAEKNVALAREKATENPVVAVEPPLDTGSK